MAGEITQTMYGQVEARPLGQSRLFAVLLAALLCAAAMWGYVNLVLIPYQVADAGAGGRPRGNLSDLYPRWLGSRELLQHGADPYSVAMNKQIQLGYYGVVLDPNNPTHPKDQQGFAYPVYVAFLLAPTLGLPFDAVQEGFGWLLALAIVLAVPAWLVALRIELSWPLVAAISLVTLGSFGAVQGLMLQQLTLLVVAMMAAALALLVRGQLAAAGAILAVATIKPQLAAPLLAGLILWCLFDLRKRQGFLWGFGVMMALLVGCSELVLPGWIGKFIAALAEYGRYTGGVSLLSTFFGSIIGGILSLLVLAAIAWSWVRAGRDTKPGRAFSEALALTTAGTLIIIPTWAPYNQVLLVPAILLLLDRASTAWRDGGRPVRYAYIFAGFTLAWTTVTAGILALAAIILALVGNAVPVQQFWTLPLYTSLFIPLAVLVALALVLRIKRDA